MKLLSDYHTHSKYSRFGHGKNTIEEMAYHANELGLEELAITDHGLKNFFGTNKEKLRKARAIIDDINVWSTTKILLGIEANLLNTNGDIDVDEDVLDLIDVLCVGYHPAIKTDFAGFFGGQKKTQAAIDRATNAYINAIKRYPINFITHIDSILTTDLYKIGCACYEHDVAIEINDRHVNWNQKQVDELLKSKCMFIVNSDAHSRDEIGRADFAFKTIKKFNIPAFRLINVEFASYEMSEEDKEMDIFYSIYKEKKELNNKKIEALNEKKTKEFTNTLSKEMEDALQEIAMEKGISYKVEKNDGNIATNEELLDEVSYYIEEMDRRKYGYSAKKSRIVEDDEEEEQEEEQVLYDNDTGSSDFFSSIYGVNVEKFSAELEREAAERKEQNNSYASSEINTNSSKDISEFENGSNSYKNGDYYEPSDLSDNTIHTEREVYDDTFERVERKPAYKNVSSNRFNSKTINVEQNFAESQSFYSGKKNREEMIYDNEPDINVMNEINFHPQKKERKQEVYSDFSEESLRRNVKPVQKDSTYSSNSSSQENNFEYLKNNSKRSSSRQSDNGHIDIFDDGIDSSRFNTNKRTGTSQTDSMRARNNSFNDNPVKSINKGTFIGFDNKISNEKAEEKEVVETPKRRTGLSNGLVDFSSLKGEDDD